jgi:hypothetical protein
MSVYVWQDFIKPHMNDTTLVAINNANMAAMNILRRK